MLSISRATIECNPLRAELVGSDRCAIEGFTATSQTPALALCRTLLAAGFDPATPFDCYRGTTLAIRVRSIGEAAKLAVEDNKTGRPTFRRWRDRPARDGAGPPVEQIGSEAVEIGDSR